MIPWMVQSTLFDSLFRLYGKMVYITWCLSNIRAKSPCNPFRNKKNKELLDICYHHIVRKHKWIAGKTLKSAANPSRSSHWQVFFKIVVLKNFAIFTGKHLCCSLFLKRLQVWRPVTLLKRDSNTGFLLWILGNF